MSQILLISSSLLARLPDERVNWVIIHEPLITVMFTVSTVLASETIRIHSTNLELNHLMVHSLTALLNSSNFSL